MGQDLPMNDKSLDTKEDTMEETYERLTKKLAPKLEECVDCGGAYWIGVAGGPGTGKSTVAKAVGDRLNKIRPDSVIVIPMDGWHIPKKALVETYGDDGLRRRGAPWTFDTDLLHKQLIDAKKAGEASLPMYSREISDPVPDSVLLKPHHKIVFVEGIYMLWKDDPKNDWGQMFDLWDETWFVKCPSREVQIDRLVQRSLKTWTDKKAQMWGVGAEGARKRVESNDLINADT
eukprot:scaffold23925_cov157-Cylindrotheca_fusiformis.AAC.1